MTPIHISPFRAGGTVTAPASKSDLHRLLILACLRDKPTKVCNLNLCDDVQATIDCLRALGAEIEIEGNNAVVTPPGFPRRGEAGTRSETDEGPADNSQEEITTSSPACGGAFPIGEGEGAVPAVHIPLLDARESASTLRFLLPVACALYPRVRFTAPGSLVNRPLSDIIACMKRHGVSFSSDTLPFETNGLLQKGVYEISAGLSSQYASGLLMASVITDGRVEITDKAVSAPYIDLTRRRIAEFRSDKTSFTAEGDWSGAAALLCLPGEITVAGLDPDSPQADKAVLDALAKSGAEISWNGDRVTVRNNEPKPFDFDITDCPDLAPCLAVLMAAGTSSVSSADSVPPADSVRHGSECPRDIHSLPCRASHPKGEAKISTLTGCRRLRYKESNRMDAIVQMVTAMGGDAASDTDTVSVCGPLTGGCVKTYSDHRIAMAGAVSAAWSNDGVTIDDADCVKKSCPAFWQLIDRVRK